MVTAAHAPEPAAAPETPRPPGTPAAAILAGAVGAGIAIFVFPVVGFVAVSLVFGALAFAYLKPGAGVPPAADDDLTKGRPPNASSS